jgi:hypothetical protein
MSKSVFTQIFLILLTTTTIVISQDSNDNQVAHIVDGIQPKINITCLCTEDEQCDSNSRTCQLSQPHHTCYESWTLEGDDGSINLSAGYVIYGLFLNFYIKFNI